MGVSESKIAFKQTVSRLLDNRNIDSADPIWNELWTLPETADDVFSFWAANDIRELLWTHPNQKIVAADYQFMHEPKRNLITLVYLTIARLEQLQTQHVFPEDPSMTNRQIVNCMRIIIRLMPFIHEAENMQEWANRFFWEPQRPTYLNWDRLNSRPNQHYDGLRPNVLYNRQDADKEIGPPLGQRLLDVVTKYMFFAGFTLPSRETEDGKPDLEITLKVWHSGVGSGSSPYCTAENFRNQYETARLLLTMASRTMYIRPDQVAMADNKALTYLTTQLNQRMINAINCSLLNTVMRFQPTVWSPMIDWEARRDNKKVLVSTCLQFLLVSMVYIPPLSPDGKSVKNLFRNSMASLFRPDDFQFINHGIKRVLEQPVSANRSFIPKSDKVEWAPDMLSFLWEMVQCNKKFRRYLCDTRIAMDYFVILLYYVMDGIRDTSNTKLGVVRMSVCILQSLSTDRVFATHLRAPFNHVDALPEVMRIKSFHGSYADFLLCSMADIIVTTEERMEPVYGPCIDIIKNIAPYQKHLERATSSKLMRIFEKLATPGYLLRNDGNNVVLKGLLQACHAILENNFEENPQFVKVLIASKHRFQALRDLTIDNALAELDRQALERKERGDAAVIRSPSRQSSFDSIRTPANARAPSLRNVPEHDKLDDHERFTIGDDEDEEGESESAVTSPLSETGPDVRLSERARGKQPLSLNETSRNASTTSLPTLTPISTSQTFRPSQQWLESWVSQSPLEEILHTIEEAEIRRQHVSSTRNSTSEDGHIPNTSREKQSLESGREARQSAQFARQSAEGDRTGSTQAARGADGQGSLKPEGMCCATRIIFRDFLLTIETGDIKPAAGGPVSFQWTAAAIGWYNALIWSRIYLQEGEAFQGPNGLYSATDIRLFRRHSAREEVSLRNPKGAIDAVGNSLAQRIGSLSITSPTSGSK
ncbi:Protein HID1, partial [Pseudocercospora fuligena]